MGADIHCWVEARRGGVWAEARPEFPLSDFEKEFYASDPGYRRHIWDTRDYGLFGVLAGVRNYSAVPPIAEPRGWPDDLSPALKAELEDQDDLHSRSYYTLKELLDFDWSKPCEDRRVTRQTGPRSWNGGCTCEPGAGEMTTYGAHCGERFTGDLKVLEEWAKAEGVPPEDVRVVFAFDN